MFWDRMGLFSRFILFSTLLLYLVGLAYPEVGLALYCSPAIIATKYQVWRLITGNFTHFKFWYYFFNVWSYIPHAMKVEQEIGTVKMFQRFLVLGFTVNLIFTLICVIGGFKNAFSTGLWPVLFAEIVIESMQDPEKEVR